MQRPHKGLAEHCSHRWSSSKRSDPTARAAENGTRYVDVTAGSCESRQQVDRHQNDAEDGEQHQRNPRVPSVHAWRWIQHNGADAISNLRAVQDINALDARWPEEFASMFPARYVRAISRDGTELPLRVDALNPAARVANAGPDRTRIAELSRWMHQHGAIRLNSRELRVTSSKSPVLSQGYAHFLWKSDCAGGENALRATACSARQCHAKITHVNDPSVHALHLPGVRPAFGTGDFDHAG